MDSVLVTGCAGFIGSHTVDALLTNGYRVLGIDAFNDYYDTQAKEANLQSALSHKRFQLLRGNLNTMDLSPLKGVEGIVHCAGRGGVRKSWNDFGSYVQDNVLATQRILSACSPDTRVVFSSSSSVYGNAPVPFTEDVVSCKPVSPYGVTKLAAEQLCLSSHLSVACLRYFTVYGPRQRPDMAFSLFIRSLLEGKPLHMFGGGNQTRDFTYVSDIVQANILALESEATGVFNIGGGNRISLNEAVAVIERVMGTQGSQTRDDVQRGDVSHTEANITKARNVLGWQPTVGIEGGIRKEVDWLRSLVQESDSS